MSGKLHVRVSREIVRRLRIEAAQSEPHLSMAAIVERALREHFERQPGAQPEEQRA